MKDLIKKFLAPTPHNVKAWQIAFGFIAMICTAITSTDTEVPKWVTLTGAIATGTTAFLAQFITRKQSEDCGCEVPEDPENEG